MKRYMRASSSDTQYRNYANGPIALPFYLPGIVDVGAKAYGFENFVIKDASIYHVSVDVSREEFESIIKQLGFVQDPYLDPSKIGSNLTPFYYNIKTWPTKTVYGVAYDYANSDILMYKREYEDTLPWGRNVPMDYREGSGIDIPFFGYNH